MNGSPILKQDNPQSSIFKVRNPCPPPNSPIGLKFLVFWFLDDLLNPLVPNADPIRPLTRMPKIFSLGETQHEGFRSQANG
ncbi:MAG: hypothetical protein JJT96_20350 [Opitutales bacterium]|nr:hypothetical protein [Opitutales bacterium]